MREGLPSVLERTRAWIRRCAACSDMKGLNFIMLYKANLQGRAVVAVWSVKLIIDHNSKVPGCPRSNYGWRTQLYREVVMKCWVGWDHEQFCLSEHELKVMVLHPARNVSQTGCNANSYSQVIWLEWEVELSIISIAVIRKAMLEWQILMMTCRWRREEV